MNNPTTTSYVVVRQFPGANAEEFGRPYSVADYDGDDGRARAAAMGAADALMSLDPDAVTEVRKVTAETVFKFTPAAQVPEIKGRD